MTIEEQNKAIAYECGWREAFPREGEPHNMTRDGGILLPYVWINESNGKRCSDLPNYCGDLNDVQDAWLQLISFKDNREGDLTARFSNELYEAFARFTKQTLISSYVKTDYSSAPAEVRAEALLRTLKLWTDE